MSARRCLLLAETLLVAEHGREAVDAALDPPSPAEERADRIARLREAGIEVEVA